MSKIKVITGIFRGKIIPFNPKKFKNADITTQMIKGAVFSILGENLDECNFLDLFAGSGQMGIEAISRGVRTAVFVDIDSKRTDFIRKTLCELTESSNHIIINTDYRKALDVLIREKIKFDMIYCDPPYEKGKQTSLYSDLLEKISKSGLLLPGARVLIQYFYKNSIPDTVSGLQRVRMKRYGSSCLSVYMQLQDTLSNDHNTA